MPAEEKGRFSRRARAGLLCVALGALRAPVCAAPPAKARVRVAPRLVRLTAADGVPLAGGFIAPKSGRPAFVLLHGVGSSRGEWSRLAERLAAAGCGSLALDFRGHGDSAPPPYATFQTPESWAKLERDIEGGVAFLEKQGVSPGRIGLIGASIGANLAVKAAVRRSKLGGLALLSAGIEYRGVRIDEDLAYFDRPLFVAAAPADGYAFESLNYLRSRVPPGRAVFAQGAQGHGAPMLDDDLSASLLAWIESAFVARPAPSGPPAAARNRQMR